MVLETKFRAFQLDTAGSLFSFYKSGHYTLIEAKIPKSGIDSIIGDLNYHGKTRIDTLHITSWDTDHCSYGDLIQILNKLRPSLIEIPSYEPDSDTGKLCKKTIEGYDDVIQKYKPNVRIMSKDYISNLTNATPLHTNNVVYHSYYNSDKKNDMSLIKLFRSNGFNVLSLGDCESQDIANNLLKVGFITTEVDLLILPHHGADNGFITGDFLDKVKPKLAVCSSNTGNQYDHPKANIRALFSYRNIPLMTTKRGDVIVVHEKEKKQSIALNFMGDSETIERKEHFTPKRHS